MRLLCWEIKKIWRWPVIFVIAALFVLYSYLFLDYHLPVIKDDLRGNYWGEVSAAIDLLERFGAELDDGERIGADALMDEYFRQLEPWIAEHPIYAEKDVHTAADLWDCYNYTNAFEGREYDEFDYFGELFGPLFASEGGGETGHVMWKIQALRYALTWYDGISDDGVYAFEINSNEATAFQESRANALTEREVYRNINSSLILEQTTMYAAQAIIIVLLGVALLLLPFLMTDNTRSIAQMQWSMRSGRGTLKTQFHAAMLSAFTLVTIETAVIAGLFILLNREFLAFSDQLIYSGLGHSPIPWLDLTYAQYGIVLIILCYVLSLGFAAIFTLLSYKSHNPVSLLLKAIPVYVVSAAAGYYVMNACLTFSNVISRLTRIPCADALTCAAVLLAGGVLCAVGCGQAMKIDLVDG